MWEEGVHIYDIPGVPNNFPFWATRNGIYLVAPLCHLIAGSYVYI